MRSEREMGEWGSESTVAHFLKKWETFTTLNWDLFFCIFLKKLYFLLLKKNRANLKKEPPQYLSKVLLRINLYMIKHTCFNYTAPWFLVYLQNYTTITTINYFRTFHLPLKSLKPIFSYSLFSSQSQETTNLIFCLYIFAFSGRFI